MTNQEALIYFKRRKAMYIDDRVQEAENIAIECIKKQIPMKAIDFVCPVCGHDMGVDEKHYCANCGQRVGDNE